MSQDAAANPPPFPAAAQGFDRGRPGETGNGFESPDKFNGDRENFEELETVFKEKVCKPTTNPAAPCTQDTTKGGLGPVYNDRACANCHQNPVSGSSSQISEIRAGFLVRSNTTQPSDIATLDFAEPTGGSLIHQRAINSRIQEHVPTTDPAVAATQPGDPEPVAVHTLRLATNILGDGFVEVVGDDDIVGYQIQQRNQRLAEKGLGGMVGLAVCVPVPVSGDGTNFIFGIRIGRFGWKCQEASLLNFSAGAYLNEMGITNPLNPKENLSNGNDVSSFDPIPDREDPAVPGHPFGADVEAFTRFMRSTKAPPTTQELAAPPFQSGDVAAGRLLFGTNASQDSNHPRNIVIDNPGIGCVVCHRETYVTMGHGKVIHSLGHDDDAVDQNLGSDLTDDSDPNHVILSAVPPALGDKVIHPYSDFMLHDIGTGDGIVQTQFAQNPPPGSEQLFSVMLPNGALNAFTDALKKFTAKSEYQYRMIYIRRSSVLEGKQPPVDPIPRRLSEKDMSGNDAPLDQRTRNKMRTAPLWGLRVRPQLLHDGSATSIDEAIRRHRGEAATVEANYEALRDEQKRQLLAFLNSLGFDNRPGDGPPSN